MDSADADWYLGRNVLDRSGRIIGSISQVFMTAPFTGYWLAGLPARQRVSPLIPDQQGYYTSIPGRIFWRARQIWRLGKKGTGNPKVASRSRRPAPPRADQNVRCDPAVRGRSWTVQPRRWLLSVLSKAKQFERQLMSCNRAS